MPQKEILVVLDFDGFLINSYKLLQTTFRQFDLDIGDEDRFRHRRKFLKYLGGGKEFLRNLVTYTLPKKKMIRKTLTEIYREEGRVYSEFVPMINQMIRHPFIHAGIISRNFTHHPGATIRTVLRNSLIDEHELDFVIPIPAGVKKHDVLEGMKSFRYGKCIFGADEIGDYRAATETDYDMIMMASYGFDDRKRLINEGEVPPEIIFDTPNDLVEKLTSSLRLLKTEPPQPRKDKDAPAKKHHTRPSRSRPSVRHFSQARGQALSSYPDDD